MTLLGIGLDVLFAWFLMRITDAAVVGNAEVVRRMLGIGFGAMFAGMMASYLINYWEAVALVHERALVTHNVRDFERIQRTGVGSEVLNREISPSLIRKCVGQTSNYSLERVSGLEDS